MVERFSRGDFLERAQVFSESYEIAGEIQTLAQQIRTNLDYEVEFEEIRIPVYSNGNGNAAVQVEINAAPFTEKRC